MTYNILPYTYEKTGTQFNRILVEKTKLPGSTHDTGLLTPDYELPTCDMGKVFAAPADSFIKEGDDVFFNKIIKDEAHLDTVEIDGKVLDVVYENEIWCCNERPIGRIFVEELSPIEVGDGELLIPVNAGAITQKGIVYDAPESYNIRKGDFVEYRKQEQNIYAEVILNEKKYTVLYEADIFRVNGHAAPYRIIVKVDVVAQHFKRSFTEKGLVRSPLFLAMLYNLQHAEVVDIGREARKMYPTLKKGDTVITHHTIEHQPYRLVDREWSATENDRFEKNVTYEYRAINCWDDKSRELFGKLIYKKETGKIIDIIPFKDSVFLKWEFDLFEASPNQLADIDTNIHKYRNLEDLKTVISERKKEAVEKGKAKLSGIKNTINLLMHDAERNASRISELEAEMNEMINEEKKLAAYLRKNHLVVCRRYSNESGQWNRHPYVITTYEELYPITILGKKFLIAHKDFLIAETNTNMNISLTDILPLGNFAIVKPVEQQTESQLLIPQSAKEKPQYGVVAAIGEHDKVKANDTVLFLRGAGVEQEIDGVPHLIMQHSDLIAVVKKGGSNVIAEDTNDVRTDASVTC